MWGNITFNSNELIIYFLNDDVIKMFFEVVSSMVMMFLPKC
jgi:hypothetical protein